MDLIARPGSSRGHLAFRVQRPGERRNLSRSATRALDVLEYFGKVRRPLRAVEIARELEMSPSSVNQLLKTMLGSAHLVFDAREKTYRPSPRLAAFGAWMTALHGSTDYLHALVMGVAERTGLTVTVTVPNDLSMQVVDTEAVGGLGVIRGMQVPLFGSATGSAYLAGLDEGEVRRLATRARLPDTDLPEILDVLHRIRTAGHADGPSDDRNMWSIAMALPLQLGGVTAVLGLGGPAAEVRDRVGAIATIMHEAVAAHFTR
jgi:DNA-binding IclR family transcriptional regulator